MNIMLRQAGLLLGVVLLAACTGQNVKPAIDRIPEAELQQLADEYNASVENEDDQIVCDKEPVAGSRFVEVQCRTKGRIQQDQDTAQRDLYKRQRNTQK